MENISNEEYVEQLEKILEEEKAKEAEEIKIPDIDKEIQNQIKQIKSLEDEIQNTNNNLGNNNLNKINGIESINTYIDKFQNKILDDLTFKTNTFFNQYDIKIKEKISQLKDNINNESEKIINKQFSQILDVLKKNSDTIKSYYKVEKPDVNILDNKDKLEPKDNSNKKEQRKLEDSSPNEQRIDLPNNLSQKKDMNKFINKEKNNTQIGNKGVNKQNSNIKTSLNNNRDMNNSDLNIKTSLLNNNKFNYKNNDYYQNDNNQKNEYNNDGNESTGPIDGKKKKQKNTNNSNKPQYSNNNNIDKESDINWQKGEENIKDIDCLEDSIKQINNQNFNSKIYTHTSFNKQNKKQNIVKISDRKNNNDLNSFNKNKENPTALKIMNTNNPDMNNNIDNGTINENKMIIPKAKEMNNQDNKDKKKERKYYINVNKVFYSDYQQKYIKIERISDIEKEALEREMVKEMQNGKSSLKDYCLNFIEENVLKLFKKNLSDQERQILQYNIESLLKICGLDIKTYRDYYYPEIKSKKKVVDRAKSIEALHRFRNEFQVSEKEFTDEAQSNNITSPKAFIAIEG